MVSVSRAKKQKKKLKAMVAREESDRLIDEKTVRLRALRLAKEARDPAGKLTE